MEATYRAFGGRLIVKFDVTTVRELFEQMGEIASVLDADSACGKCHSANIYPRAREAITSDKRTVYYYELICSECDARLDFGQHAEGGTLWPKRTDKQGNPLDNRGWYKYLGLTSGPQQAPASPLSSLAGGSGAAGPGAGEPPTPAPRPQAQPITQDPRLRGYMERMAGLPANEQSYIIGEICDAIEGHSGNKKLSDESWRVAVKRYGDPLNTPSAMSGVLNHLLGVLAIEENKKGLRTA